MARLTGHGPEGLWAYWPHVSLNAKQQPAGPIACLRRSLSTMKRFICSDFHDISDSAGLCEKMF